MLDVVKKGSNDAQRSKRLYVFLGFVVFLRLQTKVCKIVEQSSRVQTPRTGPSFLFLEIGHEVR